MSYNPNNPNGQTTAANSSPVVLASDQPALAVTDGGGSITIDGTIAVSNLPTVQAINDNGSSITVDGSLSISNFPASQAVTGTFWQATQPVSISAVVPISDNSGSLTIDSGQLPASLDADGGMKVHVQNTVPVSGTVTANIGTSGSLALDATLTGGTQKTKLVDSAGTNAATISAAGAIKVDGSAVTQPVSGTFFQATQPVSIAVAVAVTDNSGSLTVDNNGTFAVQATLAAETTKVIGTVNVAASQTIAVTQATAANLNATATPIAITKGTQGSTGFTVQDLKDAGRVPKQITLDSFAVAATAETLMTMSYSSANGTATAGTSFNVTSGKTFRLQSISAMLHTIAGNTTAVNIIVRIRVNNAGAGIITSPVQYIIPVQGVAAANSAGIPTVIPIPDGHEFPGGAGIAVTIACSGFVATTAAPKADINLTGYEY